MAQTKGDWLSSILPAIGNDPVQSLGNAAIGVGKNILASTWNPVAHAINAVTTEANQARQQNAGNPLAAATQATLGAVNNTMNPLNKNARGLLADEASYAVPFGKGANLATKAILPGMAVGGLNAAAQQNATPGSVVGNTIAGGITAPLAMGAGKLLGGLLPKIGENMQAGATNTVKQGFSDVADKSLQEHNLGDTVNSMLRYGAKTPEDFVNLSKQVTGDGGFLSKLTNQAVNQAPAMDTVGLDKFTQNLLDNASGLGERDETKVINQVNKAISAMAVPPSEMEGGESNAAMSQIRQFENQANNHSTEASRTLAPVYNKIANEMKERLLGGKIADGTMNPAGGADDVLLNKVITPDVINQANKINPQLGQDLQNLVDQGGNVAALRHLASPFVNASFLGKDALNAANNSIPKGGISSGTLATGLLPINPLATAALLAKKVLYDSGAASNARVDMLNGIGSKLAGVSLPTIGDTALGQVGARLPGIMSVGNNLKGNQGQISNPNSNTGNDKSYHGGSIPLASSPVNTNYKTINDLPTDMNNLTADPKTGNYGIADVSQLKDNNGALIAIKSGDATALESQLNDLKLKGGSLDGVTSHPASYWTNSTIGQQQIAAADATIKAKADLYTQLNPTKYEKLESKTEDARTILQQAPPNLFQLYKTVDDLRKATDPTYARLGVDLQKIAADYPGVSGIFGAKTAQVATAQLDQVNKQFLGDYYTEIRNHLPNNITGANLNQFVNPSTSNGNTPLPIPTGGNSMDIVGGTLPTIGSNNAGLPTTQ